MFNSYPGENLEFDDVLVRLFLKLHRFPWLQHLIVQVIRIKDTISFQQFVKKPIRKDVDTMDNCHFRTLYKRTAFEDSYTDPDFLSSLQLNTNLKYYGLDEAMRATSRVSLHLAVCILYFIMYYQLSHNKISPSNVLQISSWSAILGYIILQTWRSWGETWSLDTFEKIPVFSDCMVFICCGSFSYLFVPILRTVTNTMDIDTVHAVCAVLFGIHLVSNNYGLVTFCVSKPLSVNSALFSMICLSSRLQSDTHCLALLSFGILSFVCFPQFSKMLWEWTPGAWIVILVVSYAGYTISLSLSVFITSMMFIVVVVAPAMYIFYMQYKLNIMGPWDEAKLDLNFDMEEIERGFQRRRNMPPPPEISRELQQEKDEIAKLEARGIGLPLGFRPH